MLDSTLAELYEVDLKALNQAVKRNLSRFPADFMFQLNAEEAGSLRSQFVTLKGRRGTHRKYLPYVFTEQGVAMLSSVLRSERAIRVNIDIMRAFVSLRGLLASNNELAGKLAGLERKYDSQFKVVLQRSGAYDSTGTEKEKTDRVCALGMKIREKKTRSPHISFSDASLPGSTECVWRAS